MNTIPRVVLGRTGLLSSRLGLGCAVWPTLQPYETVVDVLHTAFELGIRHIDIAAKYGTEQVIGRALKDAGAPPDMVLATKTGSFCDEIGVWYREYSAETVKRSVERSLRYLQVDHLDIVHIHDCFPNDLPAIFASKGALRGLLDLKQQGVIRSIGMASFSLTCQLAAIECGEIDHIQPFHTYTLLNQEAGVQVIPSAKTRNLSILNNAPYAGYILLSGAVEGASYCYMPASQEVMAAAQRITQVCSHKKVTLPTAALAFSTSNTQIDVTVVGASTPAKLRERVQASECALTQSDFAELLAAAGQCFAMNWDFVDTGNYNVNTFGIP